MKVIEYEFIVIFIGSCLGCIGVAMHYTPLLYAAVFCLYAAKWLELIDRADIEREQKNQDKSNS